MSFADGGRFWHNLTKVGVNHIQYFWTPQSNISADATNQIFVGNLGTVITEDHLREFFSQFSPVKSVKVIKEKGGEKSRGFGFVEFEDPFGHHAVDKIASKFVTLWESVH